MIHFSSAEGVPGGHAFGGGEVDHRQSYARAWPRRGAHSALVDRRLHPRVPGGHAFGGGEVDHRRVNCSCVGISKCLAAYCKDDTPNACWNDITGEDKEAAMMYAKIMGEVALETLSKAKGN